MVDFFRNPLKVGQLIGVADGSIITEMLITKLTNQFIVGHYVYYDNKLNKKVAYTQSLRRYQHWDNRCIIISESFTE